MSSTNPIISSEIDVVNTVSSLRETYNTGKTRGTAWRKLQLEKLYAMVNENEEKFFDALSADLCKPHMEALLSEIGLVLSECAYFIDNVDRLCKDKKVKPEFIANVADSLYKRRESLGVIAIFSAWNFPVMLALLPLAGAIASGNVVILKPSEVAPKTAALLTTLIPRYLDEKCIQVINGGSEISTTLLNQRLDHIFYTGGPAIAKTVMQAAAKNLTPVTLELGGKTPVIVTDDADVSLVVNRIAFGKFFNAGQACVGVDYVLIPSSMLEKFKEAICKTVAKRYGKDPKASKDYARIVSDKHYERVKRLITDRQSGEIVVGGIFEDSERYISPTVIINVDFEDKVLMSDEIFGPVMPVITYDSLDQAITLVNSKEKPLALYIFSNNHTKTQKILERVQSGGVCVNDTMMHHNDRALPFGGVGHSGMGNYHGEHSFNTFTHERPILYKRQNLEMSLLVRYPPYTSRAISIIRALLVPHPIYMRYKSYRKPVKFVSLLIALLAIYAKYRQ